MNELPKVDGLWALVTGAAGFLWGSAQTFFGMKGRIDTHDVVLQTVNARLDKIDEKLDRLLFDRGMD